MSQGYYSFQLHPGDEVHEPLHALATRLQRDEDHLRDMDMCMLLLLCCVWGLNRGPLLVNGVVLVLLHSDDLPSCAYVTDLLG